MSTDPRPLPATYAAIVFKGPDLDPQLISAILDTEPTLSYRRGEDHVVAGKPLQRQFGIWIYSTKNRVQSTSLKQHLAALERIIIGEISPWPERALGKVQDLMKEPGMEFRVDVFWYGAADAKLPEISRSFRYVVSAAGGTIETDFHRDDEATEAA
ncbi:DUF4279 domain-containing protein [Methylobacterium oryzihabitans]|uniref:DUF4279 domain-containing protein n=1 Tax=Methylobacterium oryzihabitans TaxID=2499852 RepID=A0A3S2V4J5_9HYPH|nr:DUF4279 domain-containing protein [Methylobacterium oryzihabitans]RVU14071.1 DUF4279 domain-containing protein [Methylobacterium oryzihabitans]